MRLIFIAKFNDIYWSLTDKTLLPVWKWVHGWKLTSIISNKWSSCPLTYQFPIRHEGCSIYAPARGEPWYIVLSKNGIPVIHCKVRNHLRITHIPEMYPIQQSVRFMCKYKFCAISNVQFRYTSQTVRTVFIIFCFRFHLLSFKYVPQWLLT